jgi:hypothetical protein
MGIMGNPSTGALVRYEQLRQRCDVLSEAEIEQRLPVWHALSELFLDTEQREQDYRYIADALRSSGYGIGELRTILEEEVAPAFITNLLSVAGEWAGWSREDVRDIMLRSLRSRSRLSPLRWLRKRIHRRHVREEWEKLAAMMSA